MCQYLRHSVDSVVVSDDSVSVEATSLSDVTGSDTRLHASRSEKTATRLDASPSHTEDDSAHSNTEIIIIIIIILTRLSVFWCITLHDKLTDSTIS